MTTPVVGRRHFLRGSGAAATVAWLGGRPSSAGAEPPPETTRIRLSQIAGICIAPQYVGQELLRAEGFTDVQYVTIKETNPYPAFLSGDIDLSMAFVAPFLVQLDAALPILLLAGVHVGCFELIASDRVRTIRDLKGLPVGVPALGSPHYLFLSSMAAYVGLDPRKDIRWVTHDPADSAKVLTEGKVEAVMAFPPVPQELRARKIGHVVVNSSVDRPWSQYFCCTVGANKKFVERHPVATKRAVRAILKATDMCALEPERAARVIVERGFTKSYEHALATMRDVPYNRWRQYDPVDTVRFYALRLREVGILKNNPQKLIADGTDWRFFNELKQELKG
jgi:NitT/TauT family transport system substrate-binding protein